jgi:hypothetical protein
VPVEGHQRWSDDIAREERAGAESAGRRIAGERRRECKATREPDGGIE